jgi:hypothetical protein
MSEAKLYACDGATCWVESVNGQVFMAIKASDGSYAGCTWLPKDAEALITALRHALVDVTDVSLSAQSAP